MTAEKDNPVPAGADNLRRMKELVELLNEASRAYYKENREIMPNREYDALYDELQTLEQETGIVMAGSPTSKVGYELAEELPKEDHDRPMLSLDKTKEVEALQAFLGDGKGLLSWKLDGLTVVLTYENGSLVKAVTRGNGTTGEVITANAKTFRNIPLQIPFQGKCVLRGEAIMTYSAFEKVNAQIAEDASRYRNPRNLCSGTVRQLNSRITAERGVRFVVFGLVSAEGVDFANSHEQEFVWAKSQGFETVEYEIVTQDTLPEAVHRFSEKIQGNDYPSDGLVLLMDDIAYGISLGRTAKFPRNAMAFKWKDEVETTTLREIEWSASRTGLINPVAIFDPVELEGTVVSRASVHNVSVMEGLRLGIGDQITVYKANMIIPQIAENLTGSGTAHAPEVCPVCGGKTEIRQMEDVRSLYCVNPRCQAKQVGRFALLVSRDALNVEGLSEATLEKLIDHGWIHEFADIFHLETHKEAITSLEGFGEKSFANLQSAIDKARQTTLPRLLFGIGIPGIGAATAKVLSRAFHADLQALREADEETLSGIDGIGSVLASGIVKTFRDEEFASQLDHLLPELSFPEAEESGKAQTLAGLTFVITGSVLHFENRNALKAAIEEAGGKVTGSVSAKTNYLINNDKTSSSTKNKTAAKLGIPVISEEEVMAMMGE